MTNENMATAIGTLCVLVPVIIAEVWYIVYALKELRKLKHYD